MTDLDTDVTSEISAWLDSNPDPGIPCETLHLDVVKCNEDRLADWYKIDHCGCAKYVCDASKRYEESLAHEGGYWYCTRCGADWLKSEDNTKWRKIR